MSFKEQTVLSKILILYIHTIKHYKPINDNA